MREKIHHLDDMLKSQQRKVRQMIEQVGGAGVPAHAPSLSGSCHVEPSPVSLLLLFILLESLASIPYAKTLMATNY